MCGFIKKYHIVNRLTCWSRSLNIVHSLSLNNLLALSSRRFLAELCDAEVCITWVPIPSINAFFAASNLKPRGRLLNLNSSFLSWLNLLLVGGGLMELYNKGDGFNGRELLKRGFSATSGSFGTSGVDCDLRDFTFTLWALSFCTVENCKDGTDTALSG